MSTHNNTTHNNNNNNNHASHHLSKTLLMFSFPTKIFSLRVILPKLYQERQSSPYRLDTQREQK